MDVGGGVEEYWGRGWETSSHRGSELVNSISIKKTQQMVIEAQLNQVLKGFLLLEY